MKRPPWRISWRYGQMGAPGRLLALLLVAAAVSFGGGLAVRALDSSPYERTTVALYLGIVPEYLQAFIAAGGVLPPRCEDIPANARVPRPWLAETPSVGFACFDEILVAVD